MHQQPPYPTFITIMESRGLQDADLRVRCSDARVCALAGGAGVVVLAVSPYVRTVKASSGAAAVQIM